MSRPKIAERPQKPAEGRETAGPGHGRKTAAMRQRAILALLTHGTLGSAAAECGLNERTLRRWANEDAEFQAALAEARTATFEAGMRRIQGLTGRAVDTLADLMGDESVPTVRLGAARTVLEIATHEHDAEAIIKRLNEIEAVQRSRTQ